MNEYPRLIPDQHYGCNIPITSRWRYKLRQRLLPRIINTLIEKKSGNVTKILNMAILKQFCHYELYECIRMRKKQRNEQMYQLTLWAERNYFSQHLVNYICRFNRYQD